MRLGCYTHLLSLTLLTSSLFASKTESVAADLDEKAPNLSEIRVVAVMPSPEPEFVKTRIIFPQEGEVKTKNPISVQLQEQGFPMGVNSDFPRARDLLNSPRGQALHVVVDNHPYFIVYQDFVDALDDNENYFDQTLNFDIPFNLEPGMHVIRMFPVRSFNESLKSEGCFATRTFYFKTKKNNPDINLSAPYLT